jgi:hypothetical protein
MLVKIWVEPYYQEIDVPLMDIAEILAERYGISGKAMYKIILDYDLDLTEDLENNEEIQEFAFEIYRMERE